MHIWCWAGAQLLNHIRLTSETPWTVAPRLLCSWDSPGKNTGVGCHCLLQGIFLTQGSNPHLLHWQTDSLPLAKLKQYGGLCINYNDVVDEYGTLKYDYHIKREKQAIK